MNKKFSKSKLNIFEHFLFLRGVNLYLEHNKYLWTEDFVKKQSKESFYKIIASDKIRNYKGDLLIN